MKKDKFYSIWRACLHGWDEIAGRGRAGEFKTYDVVNAEGLQKGVVILKNEKGALHFRKFGVITRVWIVNWDKLFKLKKAPLTTGIFFKEQHYLQKVNGQEQLLPRFQKIFQCQNQNLCSALIFILLTKFTFTRRQRFVFNICRRSFIFPRSVQSKHPSPWAEARLGWGLCAGVLAECYAAMRGSPPRGTGGSSNRVGFGLRT